MGGNGLFNHEKEASVEGWESVRIQNVQRHLYRINSSPFLLMNSLVSRSMSLLMAGAIALGVVSFAVADSPTSIDIKIQRECAHLLDLTERASCEARLRARLTQETPPQDVPRGRGFGVLLQGLNATFQAEMRAAMQACEAAPEAERAQCVADVRVRIEQERALTRSLHVAPRNFRRELQVALRTEADAGEDVCRQKPVAERRQCMVDWTATMRLRVDAAIRALQGL